MCVRSKKNEIEIKFINLKKNNIDIIKVHFKLKKYRLLTAQHPRSFQAHVGFEANVKDPWNSFDLDIAFMVMVGLHLSKLGLSET